VRLFTLNIALVAVLAVACGGDDDVGGAVNSPTLTGAASVTGVPTQGGEMVVTSNIFTDGGRIPVAYTCDSDNISPDVQWSGVSDGVESFAMVMDDPDAGGFVHWVVYDIPGNAIGIPPGVTDEATLANGSVQGTNGRGEIGYTGPCPPSGEHTYVFTVYALDSAPEIEPGAEALDVITAIEGHILATGRVTGTYGR
jgi:Raf kinase inhibitor-like YbhB/YbcL family protein